MAEEIEEGGLNGGDGVDGGAEVEGLQAASGFVAVGELMTDGVEDGVVVRDGLVEDERDGFFEDAADLFAARDLACAGVAGVVGEDDQVASEEGGVGSA